MLVSWPEGLVELEEEFCVGSEGEGGDGGLLPVGEGGREGYGVVLEDAEGDGGDGVIGFYAGAVGGGDLDAGLGVAYVCYDGVEEEAGVVGFEEFGGLVLEPGVEAALVGADYQEFLLVAISDTYGKTPTVADLGEPIVGQVISCDTVDEA